MSWIVHGCVERSHAENVNSVAPNYLETKSKAHQTKVFFSVIHVLIRFRF